MKFELEAKVRTNDGRIGTVKQAKEGEGDQPEARYEVRYDDQPGSGWWPESLLSLASDTIEEANARASSEQAPSLANKRSAGVE